MDRVWSKEEFEDYSESLIIFFGSYSKGAYLPNKFEFMNIVNRIKLKFNIAFKRLYLKDLNYSWWQTNFDGLAGYGPHVLKEFINIKIRESNCKKVMAMGTSMAGYGAILFTCLCNMDLCVSISPQTFLNTRRRLKYNLYNKFKNFNINEEETDLRVVLERYNNHKSEYHIYFGEKNSTDSNNAKRISDLKGVKLFPVESSLHPATKQMVRENKLNEIIINFINGKII